MTLPKYTRRFGPKFPKPCADPTMIECAEWRCQRHNRCRLLPKPQLEQEVMPADGTTGYTQVATMLIRLTHTTAETY